MLQPLLLNGIKDVVLQEAETGRHFRRKPDMLLCSTCVGVHLCGLALESHEGTNESSRGRSAQVSSDHQQQHSIREACPLRNIPPLAERRLELCRTAFRETARNKSHITCVTRLSEYRPVTITLNSPYARTYHFCINSVILNGLNNFQKPFCQKLQLQSTTT